LKAVIQELRECGYRVELAEGKISWTWDRDGSPDPGRVTPLLECLKQNKADAMRVLLAEEVSQGRDQVTDLEDGGLGCKAEEDAPAHIHSKILKTDIWIVPDGWVGELDGVVYSDAEVRELDRLQPTNEELWQIHMAKIELVGEVVCY
jgi:hypothetical protein